MTEPALTREQSRAIDRLAIDSCGFTGLVLMENAGRGVVDVLLQVDPGLRDDPNREVVILCGKGNNAGDGFVIARHLEIRGVSTRVLLLLPANQLRGDALANYQILCHTQVPILDLSAVSDVRAALDASVTSAAWIVDAMLGTGAQGEPREPVATAIGWMNDQPAQRLAVDLPSGLDCDTGQPADRTVRADHTCTFFASKVGFANPASAGYLGQLHVISIGLAPQMISRVARIR